MVLKGFDADTIAAISTPVGEGGIGVIRISGSEAIPIADRIFESKKGIPVSDQKSFTAQYGHVIFKELSGRKEVIDEALLLVMRAPKSFTREDVVEISAHGGTATLQAILRLALKSGARPAEKGEFTKRAFLNGRIDLIQAEAVMDLVKAKTELGRQWAAAQLEGGLSEKIRNFKQELLAVLSHLEASIDFPEDFPDTDSISELGRRLGNLSQGLKRLISNAAFGILAKNGLRVVIAGRPNVGKSSLMNQLAGANRVIVTPYPGTTRDVIEEEIEIQGFSVRVSDTAGIQETTHPIEREGIERTKTAVHESDLVLYVLDANRPLAPEEEALLADLRDKKKIVVVNKTDLPKKLDLSRLRKLVNGSPLIESSCVAENGTKALEDEIVCFITNGKIDVSDEIIVTSVRQKDLLEKAWQNIESAGTGCANGLSPELIAVDVRAGLDYLGSLAGEVLTDDILEVLFSQFCIGK